MRRSVLLSFALAVSLVSQCFAQGDIAQGEVLTLQKCLQIALARHPDVLAAGRRVESEIARTGQIAAADRINVDASASYARRSPASAVDRTYDDYTASVALSQKISDSGRNAAQLRVQSEMTTASRSNFMGVAEQVAYGVREAYFGVLAAKRNVEVASEVVKQFEEHLLQAQGFYEAGVAPRFDVTKAQVDLSNAKLELIRTESALELAWRTLDNAMGMPRAPNYDIEEALTFEPHEISVNEAASRAYSHRPDLKAMEAQRRAAEESVTFAAKGDAAVLSLFAAYSFQGENFPLEEGWNTGLSISIPVVDGRLVQNQVKEAQANLQAAMADEESLRQKVLLEVQDAYLSLVESRERIAVAELGVKQAMENLELAMGRYAAGVGSPIEVTDATVSYRDAQNNHVQALYDYNIAHAALLKAMGEGALSL
ncbi:TolC family protein [Acetomicrobium sp. S15 = DSM 107314]|uniref:TolC family protein n=1 Tax=Acetomicrobium sp. S15 = DSM 107314 TaxID=2529858 RepID=UPI0018E162D2|nr:TolC family protein [Acetomicrobium sp. S15 = DSM 107314]